MIQLAWNLFKARLEHGLEPGRIRAALMTGRKF
jgi:hypothetical protein